MGIKNLWPKLNEYAQETTLTKLHEAILNDNDAARTDQEENNNNRIRKIRLGIDVSFWMKQSKASWKAYFDTPSQSGIREEKVNLLLRTIFYRLCRLSSLSNIVPIFVFDGWNRPNKRNQVTSTPSSSSTGGRKNGFVFGQLEAQAKSLIEAFGFTILQAPGEAEAELADLNKRGLIDAILSDDGDCFMFGAKVVVRNWGEKLLSNLALKARKEKNTRRQRTQDRKSSNLPSDSSDELLSTASEEDDENVFRDNQIQPSSIVRPLVTSKDQIVFYRMEDIAKEVNGSSCILLIVLLGGGDYDTEGVRQCGIQTALGLSKAGFDERLLKGVKQHLRPSTLKDDYAPEFISKKGWNEFIEGWKDDVKRELETNQSGQLSRKQKALARSEAFENLLSSQDSLTTLAAYVWPRVSDRESIPAQRPIQIDRVAKVAGEMLFWDKEYGLKTLRNSLFAGCVQQWLLDFPINGFDENQSKNLMQIPTPPASSSTTTKKPSQSSSKKGKLQNHGQDLRSMFTSTKKKSDDDVLEFKESKISVEGGRVILEVIKERPEEVYVEYDVSSLVKMTENALSEIVDRRRPRASQATISEEDELETSAQSESTVSETKVTSPRKPKKTFNPYDPIRFWLRLEILLAQKDGRLKYEEFKTKDKERIQASQKKQARQEKNKASQSSQQTLSSFFRSEKKIIGSHQRKSIPTNKEALTSTSYSKTLAEKIDELIEQTASSSPTASPSKRKAKRTPQVSSDAFLLSTSEEENAGDETIVGITKSTSILASDDSVEFVSVRKRDVGKAGESHNQAIEILD